ncbi:MAG: galactonate dehydratase [Thermotogaceae bacterium]|jgi:galactonate dehydratase|nr:galactonate dehydratase [Thermotogaceae bacterium]MDN5338268.1 galactonate dehydratase [Thermotogaceae bacterium]
MPKIVSYNLYPVPPRWMFLKLECDNGLTGWGEPVLEGRIPTLRAATSELIEKYLLGKDVSEINKLWQILHKGGFYRNGPVLMSALSGIDQALWDIKGKILNAPVYELLGGKVRDKIKVYRWVGGDEPDPETAVAGAKKGIEQGFKALKMNVAGKLEFVETPEKLKEVVKKIEKVREAVGWNFQIAIDFHGRVSPALAPKLAKMLEDIDPLFIEEPVPPGYIWEIKKIRAHTTIPIALGERLFNRWDFRPYLENGLVDILQPDISHAGGITECMKISTYAETYGGLMAYHCPLGPIALATAINLATVNYNFLIQETSLGIHYNEGLELTTYLKNPEVFKIEDGFVKPPENPGLGVEIDEEVVKELSSRFVDWSNPVWEHEDGSFAEW